MILKNQEPPITDSDLKFAEGVLGLRLPNQLKEFYLKANGGIPSPYVFENESIDTAIAAFMPLKSMVKGTLIDAYKHLISNEKIAPSQFLPFAIDGGGDYFFADTSTSDARVYFYKSDTIHDIKLVDLQLGFDEFLSSLKNT